MGLRKKMSIGFILLAVLLLFAGAVSVFELNYLRNNTQRLLDENIQQREAATKMLGAIQNQNSAVLAIMMSQHLNSDSLRLDSLYQEGLRQFANALLEIAPEKEGTTEDASAAIRSAYDSYNGIISSHVFNHGEQDREWFLSNYLNAYYEVSNAIKEYIFSPQNTLLTRAEKLETNAYRTITPSILTLAVAIIIVLMFFLLVDLYYVRPIIRINTALKNYLNLKTPFDVNVDGKDEMFELKEHIGMLINIIGQQKDNQNK